MKKSVKKYKFFEEVLIRLTMGIQNLVTEFFYRFQKHCRAFKRKKSNIDEQLFDKFNPISKFLFRCET